MRALAAISGSVDGMAAVTDINFIFRSIHFVSRVRRQSVKPFKVHRSLGGERYNLKLTYFPFPDAALPAKWREQVDWHRGPVRSFPQSQIFTTRRLFRTIDAQKKANMHSVNQAIHVPFVRFGLRVLPRGQRNWKLPESASSSTNRRSVYLTH